jgi:hypothetical protein
MSRRPIALSADLARLQNEGYHVEIIGGYLVIKDVPYVDSNKSIQRGILFAPLDLSAEVTVKPATHVAYWTGSHPCHADGQKITSIQNPSQSQEFGAGLQADFTFSAKADYRDFHHKMTTYIGRISGEASKLDGTVTAQTFPAIPTADASCVFQYEDTATSRSGIGTVNARIAGQRIAIVGMGGTGGYILDLVSKSSVAAIEIFDGDVFSQHNAFRAPGAAKLEELAIRPLKVNYFAERYGKMHKGIVPHPVFLDGTNASLLVNADFVFLCMDQGATKRALVDWLNANGKTYIDVGIGVGFTDSKLGGLVRTTVSRPENRATAAPHISFSDATGPANEYAANIQIAELNALNACMAVLCWKQHMGIYLDTRKNYYLGYSIASNELVQEGSQT